MKKSFIFSSMILATALSAPVLADSVSGDNVSVHGEGQEFMANQKNTHSMDHKVVENTEETSVNYVGEEGQEFSNEGNSVAESEKVENFEKTKTGYSVEDGNEFNNGK